MKRLFARHWRSPKQRAGFALVVALSAIVLMTVLVLAFFSRALLNRQISFSSTNQIKADMMARSALDIVVGEVRQEIADYSTISDGIYIPVTNSAGISTNMLPIKTGVSAADTNTGTYTIAKVSAPGMPIDPGTNGLALGSSVMVDAKSRNGRSENRWFSSGPRLGSAALPTWVYLSRANGATTNVLASGAANPSSTNYVVGRFSYTVYNTGGLLNANVAGHPAAASSNALWKGSIAYADLTPLGLSQPQVDSLVAWRNSGSGATNKAVFDEWATGIANGTNGAAISSNALAAAQSGHTLVMPGDNAFFSRRDLLRYMDANGIGTNAAGYLSHTTAALVSPAWRPSNVVGSSIKYGDDADASASPNRNFLKVTADAGTFTHYRDDGTSYDYEVFEGDQLVRHRFSLAKLAWLGHNGPNAAAFAASVNTTAQRDAIKACFGLEWNSTARKERWEYNHGSSSRILTLEEVKAAGREPDFFELLKAAILSGSLGGQPGPVNSGSDVYGVLGLAFDSFSDSKDRHILQIGANIIDQADKDNFPTAIYQANVSRPEYQTLEPLFNTVFGQENLPMLSRMAAVSYTITASGTKEDNTTVDVLMQPEVWNPNDSSTAGDSLTDVRYPTPSTLRLVTYGFCEVTLHEGTHTVEDSIDFGNNPDAPVLGGVISFKNPRPGATAAPLPFFADPVALEGYGVSGAYSDTSQSSGPKNRYNYNGGNNSRYLAVWLAQLPRNALSFPGHSISIDPTAATDPAQPHLTFVLEYYDGSGFRPYAMMARVSQINSTSNARAIALSSNSWQGVNDGYGWSLSHAGHPDPRTDRFSTAAATLQNGANWSYPWNRGTSIRATSAEGNQFTWGRGAIVYGVPQVGALFTFQNQPHLLDDWAHNLESNEYCWYADPDGVVRQGDGGRAHPADSGDTGDGMMLYRKLELPDSYPRRRPVIINRPFRSVGELGYAFRDQLFKTLDLSSARSADGALADVFAVSDLPVEVAASKVNVNAAPPAVFAALLSGAGKMISTNQPIRATDEAPAFAQAIVAEIDANGPMANPSDIAARLGDPIYNAATNIPANYTSTSRPFANKTILETPARALASVADTRTWNLMIDVVAQSGRLAANAVQPQDFIVEGERRYWLHLAIDRYTGGILSQQLEPVYD